MDVDVTVKEIEQRLGKPVTSGCTRAKGVSCFACGKFSHYASNCPTTESKQKHPAGRAEATSAQTGPSAKMKENKREEPSESRLQEVGKVFQED